MKPAFFAYIRVSTAKQGAQSSSLQEQRAAISAYAARNGFAITEWFEERTTAAKRGRSVFTRMLRALENDKAQGVIIHKIDRSARNLRDWSDLADLMDHGAQVHFAHDALDLKSRGGRLSADIQAVVAADYIRNLREETRKGFYGRLKQGLYPIQAPFGYLDCGRGKPKTIDPIKGPLVRQAFSLYATGEFGFKQLRDELYRLGLRTKAGNAISLHTISTMLNNPFYIGIIHIRKTNETFEGIHEPIIEKALYDRVQRVLRGERIGVPYRNDFVFRRLVRCATCSRSLIGERQKKRYIYYRCHHCPGVCVPEKVIEALFRRALGYLRMNESDVRDVRDFIAQWRDAGEREKSKQKSTAQMLITKCDQRLTILTDALLDGVVDKETFETRKKTLIEEKRGYLDAVSSEEPSIADLIEKKLELAITAYLRYEIDDPEEKREVVRSVTSNLEGRGKNVGITLDNPFQELVDYQISLGCDPNRRGPRTSAEKIFKIIKKQTKKELKSHKSVQGASEAPTPPLKHPRHRPQHPWQSPQRPYRPGSLDPVQP